VEDIKEGEVATDLVDVANGAVEGIFSVEASGSTVVLLIVALDTDSGGDCIEGETGRLSLGSAFFLRLDFFFFFFLAVAAPLSSSALASSITPFGEVATITKI